MLEVAIQIRRLMSHIQELCRTGVAWTDWKPKNNLNSFQSNFDYDGKKRSVIQKDKEMYTVGEICRYLDMFCKNRSIEGSREILEESHENRAGSNGD